MNNLTCIVFDLDGTLVDSFPGIHQSVNAMLRGLSMPEVDLQTIKRRVGRGMHNLVLETVGKKNLEQGISLFREHYDRDHLNGTFLYPGVIETLQGLMKSSFRMAVASNKPPDFSKSILKHFHIEDFFQECMGPGGNILPKPHPSMLQELMRKLGANESETLYVGDMTLDVETARNAGVQVALIASGAYSVEELRAAEPEFLFQEIRQLLTNFRRDGDR